MPFRSKAQMRKCYVSKDPKWDCDKMADETPNPKKLPEKSSKKSRQKKG